VVELDRGALRASILVLLILLCSSCTVRAALPSATAGPQGAAAEEEATLDPRQDLPSGSIVAAASPDPVTRAGIVPTSLSTPNVPSFEAPEELLVWMRRQGIRAIYADSRLSDESPELWALIEMLVGRGVVVGFEGDGGSVRVLLVQTFP